MVVEAPGRNEPCPCGSGQKFKRCCLAVRTAEDSALLRLRAAEGRVVNRLLHFIATTWGEPLVLHAWEDFWNYDDVPEDLDSTPEFDPMFVPWLVLGFVPDAESDDAAADWPTQPIGLEWVAEAEEDIADLDRAYIDIACRSPLSVFVVEQVTAGRSLDLKDVLTGARFHVLERSASTSLLPADLIFMRVVTIDGISLMFGVAPFVVPPRWHTRIIDWREKLVRKRLMTRQDPAEAIEERDHQRTGEPGDATLPESSGEFEAIQHEMTRNEWNEWVDTRVPALGNKTPRQASRTAAGREKLEALLSEFARYAADGLPDDARHIATIRATLGLEKR